VRAFSVFLEPVLRPAADGDFEFAFKAKREALGPYVEARWGWDESMQRDLHRARWVERSWFIVVLAQRPVGTVSVELTAEFVRFGEFYLLPAYQGQGLGAKVLRGVLARADASALPVKLEYLKCNPVGSLYRRPGFEIVAENDTHFFLVRRPARSATGSEYHPSAEA
jgi:GNAT superfamily N-acetyltransferase